MITFLSGHMCSSTWAGAVVLNDSILKRKASLVIVIASGNKIPKGSSVGHQRMFGNKLMAVLVTMKTMADQKSE